MQPKQRFRKILEAEFGAEGNAMSCREELIRIVERAVRRRGQCQVLSAYLKDTFRAKSLADLADTDLERALLFIEVLEGQAPFHHHIPLPPGVEADGHWCMFSGRLTRSA